MLPKFAKPPLVEAACELRLHSNNAWDLTIPGRLFEKLQPDYSERRQLLGVELEVDAKGQKPPDYRQIENLHFLSKDGKNIVQVREHAIAVSRLAPYESWERYKPRVMDVFKKFEGISGGSAIARLGLKYVNRIVVPQAEIRLEEFLDFYPFVGSRLPQQHGPFLVGVIFPFEGPSGLLKTELTSANPDAPGTYHILLTLDYFTEDPAQTTFEGISVWLDFAHERIEQVFINVIKDRTRQLFESRD